MTRKYDNRKMRKNITNEDLHLCSYAAEKIKAIGFRLVHTSSCTEACYYDHPIYDGMLRIAAHKYGNREYRSRAFPLMKPVVACITFGAGYKAKSYVEVDNYIALGVGNFVLGRLTANLKKKERDEVLNNAATN